MDLMCADVRAEKQVSSCSSAFQGILAPDLSALLLVCFSALPLLGQTESLASRQEDPLVERLRHRIEMRDPEKGLYAVRERIHTVKTLARFYEMGGFQPAWSTTQGPTTALPVLLELLRQIDQHGLDASDYHLSQLEEKAARASREGSALALGDRSDLELLATDVALLLAAHMLAGRVNPESVDPEWNAQRRERDLAEFLFSALAGNDLSAAFRGLLPEAPGYEQLRRCYLRWRNQAKPWQPVPAGPLLKRGDSGPRVRALRERLLLEPDLPLEPLVQGELFDESLERAVKAFQGRYGLDTDGKVGSASLEALNQSLESRLRQMAVNLDRWRWLPQNLGKRHILVNIAGFDCRVVENDQTLLRMDVVVGRNYRRTPVFSGNMTYLVLSPAWEIPPELAIKDKLPLIRKDPAYLGEQHIRVLSGWGADAREVDPASVDWRRVGVGNFRYRLRQDPGPWNALGQVKFMFPNKFNIYLHDTPAKELFAKSERAFSSGCVRVSRPLELAELLLQGMADWARESIRAAMESGKERTVPLPKPIPVHLLYWTAWVDEDGQLNLRKDIYGRDALVDQALNEAPPAP